MSAKSTKLITYLLRGVLLGAILCILGCIGLMALNTIAGHSGQLPIRSLRITIDGNRREELFTQLQGFAEKHAFEILIREVEAHPDGIYIEMSRNDLKILAHDISDAPSQIIIWFYNKSPASPASQETVDELLNDLKSYISEIPNVTVTEEK